MKKILIATGDAAEALEVMYPLQRCQEAGCRLLLATLYARHQVLNFLVAKTFQRQ